MLVHLIIYITALGIVYWNLNRNRKNANISWMTVSASIPWINYLIKIHLPFILEQEIQIKREKIQSREIWADNKRRIHRWNKIIFGYLSNSATHFYHEIFAFNVAKLNNRNREKIFISGTVFSRGKSSKMIILMKKFLRPEKQSVGKQ